MTQQLQVSHVPEHIAIIMDGNGRWAKHRGLIRTAGHKQGVETVRNTVRTAGEIGVKYLTLFAFSSENWTRPEEEVGYLMGLLKTFIQRDLSKLARENVKINIIGSRQGLQSDILQLLEQSERDTVDNTGLNLIIAFNYGSRDEIVRAAQQLARDVKDGKITPEQISQDMLSDSLDTSAFPDPDLIIRTSGEQRLSNFLLWQAAYSEFVFVDCLWPDFGRDEFLDAIAQFNMRDRRFGAVSSIKCAASS